MTDKQSVFLLCCKIDKRKNTSYLSNNCKYDVFYNYVKILNLMTLLASLPSFPLYFVTFKENPIMEDLNSAQTVILNVNPNFDHDLYT
ncbi:hypothetical protein, partial [Megamonas funiformis]|uniref:hypothetical protein n=1 Tax=Megamonas funiformis TaxID=437897 RepID=UPI003F80844D